MNKPSISHDFSKESPEEKVRWFQNLTLEERMDLLCFYTDLILSNNPDIIKKKDVRPAKGRIQKVARP